MTTVTGSDLGLGVIFTGKVDQAFHNAVNKLRTAITGLASTSNLGVSAIKATASASEKSTKAVKHQADEFSILGKKIGQVEGGFQRLTQAMKVTASYGLASSVLFGMISALRGGTKEIANFDQSLKDLKAVTNSTDAEIGVLSERIREVVSSTKYNSQEVPDAALVIGQAGYNAAETSKILGSVALLATGTLEDMAQSADLVTSALSVFHLKATDSARVADVFANAVNYSKLSVEKLRTAFNYVAPIAEKAGYSLESLAVMMEVMANSGIKSSTIGTGLRQVLARLIDPNEKLAKAFKTAGVDMEKLNPKTASLVEIFKEFKKVVPDAARAYQLFGMLGASTASVISATSENELKRLIAGIYEVGSTSRMAETQMEGLNAMASNLMGKLGLLAIAIGEGGVAGSFKLALNVIRPVVDVLTWMANTLIGKITSGFVALAATIGAVTLAFKYLAVQMIALSVGLRIDTIKKLIVLNGFWATSVEAVGIAYARLWAALSINPFVKVAALIALAASAIYTLVNHLRTANQKLEEHVIKLTGVVDALEEYKKKLSEAKVDSEEYKAIVKRLAAEFPELADSIDAANGKLKDNGKALDDLTSAKRNERLEALIDQIRRYRAQAALAEKATAAWAAAQDKLHIPKDVANFLERMAKGALDSFNVAKKWRETQAAFGDLVNSIEEAIGGGFAGNKETIDKIEEFADKLSNHGENIKLTELEISQALYAGGMRSAEAIKITTQKIKKYYEELAKTQAKAVDDIAKKSQQVGDKFKEVSGGDWYAEFQKLSKAGDLFGIANLEDALRDAESKIDTFVKESLIEQEGYYKNTERYEKTLAAARKAIYAKTLKDHKEKISKEEDAEAKKFHNLDLQLDKHIANQEGKLAEIEAARQKDLEKAKGRSDLIDKINETYDAQRTERLQEIANLIEQNTITEIGLTQGRVAELQAEIKALREKRDLIAKGPLKGEEKTVALDTADKEILKAEKEMLKESYNEQLLGVARFSEKYTAIHKKMLEDKIITQKEYMDYMLALQEKEMDKTEELYERKLISGEKYYQDLKALNEYTQRLTPLQLEEKRIEATGTTGERFQMGIDRARAQVQSLSQLMIKVGEEIPEQISTNLTDSLFEIAEGAKSAKDAFSDFAKNTLKWLAELIVKQQLYNIAVQGSGLVKSGASALWGAVSNIALAEGGWIKEPVIGKGVKSGRTYTLAEQGPEYVSPGGKMSAAAKAPSVTVNVINKTGTDATAKQEGGMQWDGERWVLSVVMNAVGTNKGGFAKNLSAALAR